MKEQNRIDSREKIKQYKRRHQKAVTEKPPIILTQIIDDYVIQYNEIIGQGTYGKVYKTYKYNSNQQFACKFIKQEKLDDLQIYYKDKKMAEELEKRLIIEGKFQMTLADCPYITRMYKTVKNQKGFFFVMEYCSTDLSKILKKQGYLHEDVALKYFKQTIEGIKFIYEKNAFHRDLKPQNLLLKNDTIKITDFGFVKIFDEIGRKAQSRRNRYFTQSKVRTFRYMSPDILALLNAEMKQFKKQQFHSIGSDKNSLDSIGSSNVDESKNYQPEKSDIWSLGIILYKMLYGKQPYDGKSSDEMLRKINQEKLNFPGSIQFPPGKVTKINVSKSVIKLIKRMLVAEQNERISFLKLYEKLNKLLEEREKEKLRSRVEQAEELNGKNQKEQIRNKQERLLIVYNKIMIRIYKDLSTFATLRQLGIENYSEYSYKIMTLLHQKRIKYLKDGKLDDISNKQQRSLIDPKVKQDILQYHKTFYEQIKSLSNLHLKENLQNLLKVIYEKLIKYEDFDMLIKQVQIFLLFLLQLLCLEMGLIKEDYICATDDKTQSLKIKSIENFKNDVIKLLSDHLNKDIDLKNEKITSKSIKKQKQKSGSKQAQNSENNKIQQIERKRLRKIHVKKQ